MAPNWKKKLCRGAKHSAVPERWCDDTQPELTKLQGTMQCAETILGKYDVLLDVMYFGQRFHIPCELQSDLMATRSPLHFNTN